MLRILKKGFWLLFISHWLYLILLKWVFPPITINQLASLLNGNGLKRDYVPMASIHPNARLAFIASEDQLFPLHNGFDWGSIEKALLHNNKSKRIRGASTISQQVAKNVFLWNGRNWFRKGLEVYFTFLIEWAWGKERILEIYLNVAETGKGVFGIESASWKYFNKPASKLNRNEAAMIASCLPNPIKYTVKPLSNYVNQKHQWVLGQMNNIETDPDIEKILDKSHRPSKN